MRWVCNLTYALSVEFDTRFGTNEYDIQNDHFSLHINGNNITGSKNFWCR